MKFIKSLIVVLLTAGLVYAAGSWSTYNWSYKPQLTTQGTTDYAQFNISQDRIDAELNKLDTAYSRTAIFGNVGYTTLAEAITTIGSTNTLLVFPTSAGAVAVPSGVTTTIPANVQLQIDKGAYFNIPTASTLTINGPIEAGPYQIFAWTGTGAISLSGSPTAKIQIAWFGGVKGTGQDNAAVITKMAASLGGFHQAIHIDGGSYYRIATPVSLTQNNILGFTGDSQTGSKIYIEVGAGNDGLTLTKGTGYAGYWFENLAFVGPANACRRGINIYDSAPLKMTNVALYMGATSYALALDNVDYYKLDNVDIGHFSAYPIFSDCTKPHDGIGLLQTSYAANVGDCLVYISGMTAGDGIYIAGGENIKLKGSIENCATAIKIRGTNDVSTRPWSIELANMNMVDLNVVGIDVDAVNNMFITNCLIFGTNTLGRVRHTKMVTTNFNALTVKSDCVDVSFEGVSIETSDAFVCDAQSAVFVTPIRVSQQADNTYVGSMPQLKNWIANSSFERWNSSTAIMDGWADGGDGTHTQCGTGLVDTTRHIAAYCDKANTNGHAAIGVFYNTITGTQLNSMLGKYCSASMWVKPTATGATAPTLIIDTTVPTWSNGVAYKVNDFVRDISGNFTFKCVVAGTSGGSEPTWSTQYQRHTTDNGITWIRENAGNYSRGAVSTLTNNVWTQVSASCIVPQNATALYVYINLYQTAGSVDVDYYIAEPCLTNGGAPQQFVESYNQYHESIQLGASKMTWGATTPTLGYSQQGDIHWYTGVAAGAAPGAVCTTSGLNLAGAVWKDMATVAP